MLDRSSTIASDDTRRHGWFCRASDRNGLLHISSSVPVQCSIARTTSAQSLPSNTSTLRANRSRLFPVLTTLQNLSIFSMSSCRPRHSFAPREQDRGLLLRRITLNIEEFAIPPVPQPRWRSPMAIPWRSTGRRNLSLSQAINRSFPIQWAYQYIKINTYRSIPYLIR